MKTGHSIKVFVVPALLVLSVAGQAEEGGERESRGFRFGLDLGAGSVERKVFDFESDETNFYMGFSGGYWFSRHVLAGLELSGWLLEASNLNDPTVGEGISRVYLFAQIYPSTEYPAFLKVSGGYASHWNHRPGEPTGSSGDGYEIGGGYDFGVGKPGARWFVTPFATYSAGSIGDEDHAAITVGVGFSFEF